MISKYSKFKRFGILAVCMIMLGSLTGCTNVYFMGNGGGIGSVYGSGAVVTKSYDVEPYQEVVIKTKAKISYQAADSDHLSIDMKENLEQYIKVESVGGVLTISSSKNISSISGYDVTIYLAAETLTKLRVDGDCALESMDGIVGDEFYLQVNGVLDGNLDLDVNDLSIDVAGSCDMSLSGSAKTAAYEIDGAGKIDSLEMPAQDIEVTINGSGTIDVDCSDSLRVEVNGMGNVNYRGTGTLESVSGFGTVNRID